MPDVLREKSPRQQVKWMSERIFAPNFLIYTDTKNIHILIYVLLLVGRFRLSEFGAGVAGLYFDGAAKIWNLFWPEFCHIIAADVCPVVFVVVTYLKMLNFINNKTRQSHEQHFIPKTKCKHTNTHTLHVCCCSRIYMCFSQCERKASQSHQCYGQSNWIRPTATITTRWHIHTNTHI